MRHRILKDFPGSQDGTRTESFTAGTVVELSTYLAAIAVREGWAEPVAESAPAQAPGPDNKAITTDGEHPAPAQRRTRRAAVPAVPDAPAEGDA